MTLNMAINEVDSFENIYNFAENDEKFTSPSNLSINQENLRKKLNESLHIIEECLTRYT